MPVQHRTSNMPALRQSAAKRARDLLQTRAEAVGRRQVVVALHQLPRAHVSGILCEPDISVTAVRKATERKMRR